MQKSDAAPSTQLDCEDLELATIQAKVYDQDGGLVASSALWPCEEHHGTMNSVKTGPNYTLVILGRKTDQESDPVIIHGQRPEVTIRNNEATSVEVEVQTFVPAATGMAGSCDKIIFEWGAIPGANSYELTVSENSDMSNSSTHSAAENSFAPQGLEDDKTYYWQVKASDAYGNVGHGSNTANFTTGGPQLVKDFSAGTTLGSDPSLMVVINDDLYFAAWDETGRHLWRYDGIQPKKIVFDHSENAEIREIVEYQNDVYVSVQDRIDSEIWKVDGDTAYKIDINSSGHSKARYLTVFDGHLYFVATNGERDAADRELYRFDGADWTKIDIDPSGSSHPSNLCVAGDALYFAASTEIGHELHKWDGQKLTAFDVNEGNQRHSVPYSLTAVNNQLYFSGQNGAGRELYLYDSQNTEQPIKIDVCKGGCGSSPKNFTGFNGALYFSAVNEQGDHDLFMYPGSGTEAVNLNINPTDSSSPYNIKNIDGALYYAADFANTGHEPYYYSNGDNHLIGDLKSGLNSSYPSEFTGLKDRIYFQAEDSPKSGRELWSALKTTYETRVIDICPGACSSNPDKLTTVEFNGEPTLFFSADNGRSGIELWEMTSSGTPRLVDVNKAIGGGKLYGMTESNGMLYFGADDGENGTELWESDGTAKGTRMVADINPNGDSHPFLFTSLNDKLYFIAKDESNESWLYEYDGTVKPVIDIQEPNSYPNNVVAFSGKLYVITKSTNGGEGLWKYDGNKKPRKLVHSTLPDDYSVYELAIANGLIYFFSTDKNGDMRLYKYDGQILAQTSENAATASGTLPDNLMSVGNDIYFETNDENRDAHLFRFDGAATTKIQTNQSGDSSPKDLTGSAGKLYFSASDDSRRNLYIYENSELNKIEVDPGTDQYEIQDFFAVNGTLYMIIEIDHKDSGTADIQLWKSNSASQAAEKVIVLRKDIKRFTSHDIYSFAELNGKIYFSLIEGHRDGFDYGPVAAEIWETDGTAQNTLLLFEASNHVKAYFEPELLAKDGTLYYIFYDPQYGTDIWRYCP